MPPKKVAHDRMAILGGESFANLLNGKHQPTSCGIALLVSHLRINMVQHVKHVMCLQVLKRAKTQQCILRLEIVYYIAKLQIDC